MDPLEVAFANAGIGTFELPAPRVFADDKWWTLEGWNLGGRWADLDIIIQTSGVGQACTIRGMQHSIIALMNGNLAKWVLFKYCGPTGPEKVTCRLRLDTNEWYWAKGDRRP